MKISHRGLLSIYLIFPVCVLVYLVDQLFLDSTLKYSLRMAPEHYFWLSLFFGTPHIIASNVILFSNKDYLQKYWANIVWVALIIIAFFGVGNYVLSFNVLFAIVATITIIHVVKQQIGIGNSVAKLKGPLFSLWSWSVIGSGIVLYNAIFLKHIFTANQKANLFAILALFCVLICILAVVAHQKIKSPLGQAFLWANSAMALLSFFFYAQGYYFLAVLGPRVTHDVTAFVFYVVHDNNRHQSGARNFLYRIFNAVRIPSFIAVPVLAIAVTFVLQGYGDALVNDFTTAVMGVRIPKAITLGFIGYLSLLHYYTESFTWKGNSPYRKFI